MGWGLCHREALEDLVSKCAQRMTYLAGNLSSPLLLVHKFPCVPQLGRGQGRELLVFSPTTTFPGTRSKFLVGPFRHFAVPAVEPQHYGNQETLVGASKRLLQALEFPK